MFNVIIVILKIVNTITYFPLILKVSFPFPPIILNFILESAVGVDFKNILPIKPVKVDELSGFGIKYTVEHNT